MRQQRLRLAAQDQRQSASGEGVQGSHRIHGSEAPRLLAVGRVAGGASVAPLNDPAGRQAASQPVSRSIHTQATVQRTSAWQRLQLPAGTHGLRGRAPQPLALRR
jgi:hypothetical protein